MMKHTPGPRSVTELPGCYVVRGPERAFIGRFDKEADAELDAATPELLEALRAAAAQMEADHDPAVAAEMFGSEPHPTRAMNINRHDVIEMCRVTIAKATGNGT